MLLMNNSQWISNAPITKAIYTFNDCPRYEFMIGEKPAFISEVRADYLGKGFVKLFSFDTNTRWEKILPEAWIQIEDRTVKLPGFTNEPRIIAMARKFKDDLDNDTFQAGAQPDLKALFANITQL